MSQRPQGYLIILLMHSSSGVVLTYECMYSVCDRQGKMWDWDAVDADHMGATSSGPPSGGLVNLNRADTAEDAFGFGMQTTGGDSRGDAFFGDSRGDNQRNSSLFDSSPNNNSGRRPATSGPGVGATASPVQNPGGVNTGAAGRPGQTTWGFGARPSSSDMIGVAYGQQQQGGAKPAPYVDPSRVSAVPIDTKASTGPLPVGGLGLGGAAGFSAAQKRPHTAQGSRAAVSGPPITAVGGGQPAPEGEGEVSQSSD